MAGLKRDSGKMLQAYIGLGVLCGLLIAVIYGSTYDLIQEKKRQALHNALVALLPQAAQIQGFYLDADDFFKPGQSETQAMLYAGFDEQRQLLGLVVRGRGMGYQDSIELLYAYVPAQRKIVGLSVIESRETPGLGARIVDDAAFLANFSDLSVTETIGLARSGRAKAPGEVDAISGATVSSQAVLGIINQSNEYWLAKVHAQLETLSHAP